MANWGLVEIIAHMRGDVLHQSHNAVLNPWYYAGKAPEITGTGIMRMWWRRFQTNRLKHRKRWELAFYEAIREHHSERAASWFSLNVLRVESDLCELNRLWNEAWIEANFCRLFMRLNRSRALSPRRNGKCEFSALLFDQRLVNCFSEQPNSFVAAP